LNGAATFDHHPQQQPAAELDRLTKNAFIFGQRCLSSVFVGPVVYHIPNFNIRVK
jgi:hypothetical protein